jgi:hypothetical protein
MTNDRTKFSGKALDEFSFSVWWAVQFNEKVLEVMLNS